MTNNGNDIYFWVQYIDHYIYVTFFYSFKAQEKQQSHWMEGLSPPQSAEIKILA